ncbi:alkaline phosphatase [Amycolatopsis mediterranei S699]|uniref:Alkaline phosphatase n=2 Tax=Amycolatopsis mediterranei TaxID=33910 RepID=A0A0H3CZA1_AMYMU|nr:discoidin domain-containing protein [Amycolatopsis mediterranei]ADJ43688.1 alkaline phosphatase [Amycolatopsis mediterranei U32]AEK40396.1 alkaline phosphatase [Amycolatopsis mediterranei S699]AFO75400.1 alkaline phosphatase [Amycolatopsis mediterranei S699]AGT82529.1 alkaline phosphatase [Amycolatopsis mediterranei RB]KDO10220.1 alkaline phosphatase [Amycolatopsis mediterranei]
MLAAVVLLPSAIAAAATTQAADVLLSQGKPVATSTTESSSYTGAKAVDGSTTTRWASAEGADPQWLRIDLGQSASIHRVVLNWEAAYAKKYRIEVSDDGTSFTTAATVDTGDGKIDDLGGLTARGRFVRFVGLTRATSYGYSFWEMQVFGTNDSSGDTQAPTTPAGLTAGTATATSVPLSWGAATDNVGVTGYDVLRNGTAVATSATTSYTDTGLTPNTSYTYAVRARDTAGNTSPASTPITVTTAAGSAGFVLAAAGDIAEKCTASSSSCVHPKTAKLVENLNPAAVITMGDNQYDEPTLSDFKNYYDKTWGKFKNITHPSPGNHESYSQFTGYDQYFGAIAKPQGQRYYSWEMGNWHFIALDSNDFVTHDEFAEPPQITWLKQDLANNTKGCVAAYYHHPRWSSGDHGDNKDSIELWNLMVADKVDLVLNGHDHDYERFVPQNADGKADANGPVEIVGGSGGADLYDLSPAHPTTAKLLKTFGVLKLSMTDTSFQTQLIGVDGKVLDSSPAYTCHR